MTTRKTKKQYKKYSRKIHKGGLFNVPNPKKTYEQNYRDYLAYWKPKNVAWNTKTYYWGKYNLFNTPIPNYAYTLPGKKFIGDNTQKQRYSNKI